MEYLYYLTPTDTLTSVPLDWAAGFAAGTPRPLFDSSNVGKGVRTRYDVDPDGERFLVNVVVPGATPPPITVVLKWTADRKK